ncbi:hypothetical protein D3C81_1857440 [compost metagenome]
MIDHSIKSRNGLKMRKQNIARMVSSPARISTSSIFRDKLFSVMGEGIMGKASDGGQQRCEVAKCSIDAQLVLDGEYVRESE